MIQQLSFSIVLLAIIVIANADDNSTATIYGVRWFLGEHFSYQIDGNSDNNEYFVLAFNSDQGLKGDLSALIGKNRFACTFEYVSTVELTKHHPQVENFTNDVGDDIVDNTYIHKCIIGDVRAIINNSTMKIVNYSITLDSMVITQSTDPSIDKRNRIYLYNGSFRLPYYESSFQALVIGDWGEMRQAGLDKGYIDPFPCLLKKLDENPNIVMIIFTGDLAYDLQGGKYYSMLKFMQPLTSKVTLVVTPGNHDTLYHDDTFVLFTKTYYTPQYWSYSNYFNKFTIGKLLFIFYTPQLQEYDFKGSDRLKKSLTTIFDNEFTADVVKSIRQSGYFPIVVSHYPIYCSNINDDAHSCERNIDRFKTYRQYFNKIDMKIYISGHLHVYQRTVPICFNGSFTQVLPDDYDMSCPVYIVQGAGGNDFYVQTQQQCSYLFNTDPKKAYSSAIVYNTGFGILTINSASQLSYPKAILYQHISAVNCFRADHFQMTNTFLPQNSNSNAQNNDLTMYLGRILIKTAVLLFVLSVIISTFYLIKKRYRSSNPLVQTGNKINHENHVEMVQQNFDAPQSDKPEPGLQ